MLANWRKLGTMGREAAAAPTVRTAAKRLKMPQTKLYRLAKAAGGWWRAARRLSQETLRHVDALLADGVTIRDICERLGIGKGSVSRRRQHHRERNGELAPGQWWRCPQCGGKILVVRCRCCQLDRPANVLLRNSGARS